MASFTGTSASERVTPGFVSPTVVRVPPGSHPSPADDVIDGGAGDDVLQGAGGTDAISGGDGADRLDGGGGVDGLDGGDGDDVIRGGNGDDQVLGGHGDDQIDGGDGFDTADYSGTTAGIVARFEIDRSRVGNGTITGSEVGRDELLRIERVLGGDGDDRITGFGQTLEGGGGDDVLKSGSETHIVLHTTTTLRGGGGDDLLHSGLSDDVLDGGAGIDTVSYRNVPDAHRTLVDLSISGPQFTHRAGTDTLIDVENLIGSIVGDTFLGNSGDNILWGLGGMDFMSGAAGDDTLFGGSGHDGLSGGEGDDTISGGDDDDTLQGNSGDDMMRGGSGNDELAGGSGDDSLRGEAGDDVFVFRPDGGTDRVWGFGDGADRLSFAGFGAGFDTAAEILAMVVDTGANLRLALPGASGPTVVVLIGLEPGDLQASDLIVVA